MELRELAPLGPVLAYEWTWNGGDGDGDGDGDGGGGFSRYYY